MDEMPVVVPTDAPAMKKAARSRKSSSPKFELLVTDQKLTGGQPQSSSSVSTITPPAIRARPRRISRVPFPSALSLLAEPAGADTRRFYVPTVPSGEA